MHKVVSLRKFRIKLDRKLESLKVNGSRRRWRTLLPKELCGKRAIIACRKQ